LASLHAPYKLRNQYGDHSTAEKTGNRRDAPDSDIAPDDRVAIGFRHGHQ
jgi:hypothetical protein